MPKQGIKDNKSGLKKSVLLFLMLFTIFVLTAGFATPAGAVNTTPTATIVKTITSTTFPTINPTHTVTTTTTVIPSVTTIRTTTTTASTLPQPVAGFTSDISSGPAPLTVQFTDLSGGGPVSWSWTFGDGNTDTVQNPSHTYYNSGTYTVTLTATTRQGAAYTASETNYITVDIPVTESPTETPTTVSTTADTSITAEFTGSPRTGNSPLNVNFIETSTGSPSFWKWDFGDGIQSSVENPSHTYTVPGSYSVSLRVTGSGGTDVKALANYITVTTGTAAPTLVTTQFPVSIITNNNTGVIQTPATYPTISRLPTGAGTPAGPAGGTGEQEIVYFILFVVIAIIALIAAILYNGAGTNHNHDKK